MASNLLIDEQPLQVIPTLACKIGLNRAMFLQQLHYWLKKSKHVREGRKWVFNTYEEWHEQFPFWTAEAVRKIVTQLEAKGIIETTDRFNERKGDRTKWYTIDYGVFAELLGTQEKRPDKSTEQPENPPPQGPDKSTERYQREHRDSPRGARQAEAPEGKKEDPPAKAMTAMTIDRSRLRGFYPSSGQVANWGKGWSDFIYVGEDQEPPSADRQLDVLQVIEDAAAGKLGKTRFFLSVQDAAKRLDGNVTDLASRRGPPDKPKNVKVEPDGSVWINGVEEA